MRGGGGGYDLATGIRVNKRNAVVVYGLNLTYVTYFEFSFSVLPGFSDTIQSGLFPVEVKHDWTLILAAEKDKLVGVELLIFVSGVDAYIKRKLNFFYSIHSHGGKPHIPTSPFYKKVSNILKYINEYKNIHNI